MIESSNLVAYSREIAPLITKGYENYTFLSSLIYQSDTSQRNNTNNYFLNGSDWTFEGIINYEEDVYAHPIDNSTSIKPVKDVGLKGVLMSSVFNFFLFLFLVFLYEVLRRYLPNIYASKFQREAERQRILGNETATTNLDPLSWLGPVFGVSWTKILEEGGLDAYMYLRYIWMCLRITSVSAFWGLIILLPVYGTAGGGAKGFYFISMKNIKDRDPRFWISALFMYLFTMYFFYAMLDELQQFVALRLEFLGKGLKGQDIDPQHQYSLMVENIPKELRSDKALFHYFEQLFPGKVHSARVVVTLPELNVKSARKLRITRRLEKSIAIFEATQKRPTHAVGARRISCCGVEGTPSSCNCRKKMVDLDELEDNERVPKGSLVDSVSYYTRDLKLLNRKFLDEQKAKNDGAETGNVSVLAENWFTYIAKSTSSLEEYVGMTRVNKALDNYYQKGVSNASIHPQQQDHGDIEQMNTPLVDNDHTLQTDDETTTMPVDTTVPNRKLPILLRIPLRLGFDFVWSGYKHLRARASNVAEEQSQLSTMSSTGFVTFLDLASVTSAVNTPLTHKPLALITKVAPEHRDLYWNNAHVSFDQKIKRERVASISVGLGAILWSIPVAVIQGLARVNSLGQIPGLAWLGNVFTGEIKLFVDAYLPVIALLIIMMVLPMIFESIAVNFEKRKTWSDIHRSVVGRYFYYQMANVYIVVTAGSIWISLGEIINHPGSIFVILGEKLPSIVGYFASILVTKTLAGLPLVILRTGSVFRFLWLRLLFRTDKLTQRELDEVYRQERLYYGWEYPNQLFVIVICMTYVCVAPIILVVGAIYFSLAIIVYTKQVLFVYTPSYESGGTLFPIACARTSFALFLGQLTLIGYLFIRRAYGPGLLTMPLLGFTPWFMFRLQRNYIEPSIALTLERAVEVDKFCENTFANSVEEEQDTQPSILTKLQELFRDDYYRQPVLTEKASVPLPYRRGYTDPLTQETIQILESGTDRAGVPNPRVPPDLRPVEENEDLEK